MSNIANKVAQIRQAVLGRDVRESIASGIESINSEVESTTARQEAIDTNENRRISAETGRVTAETGRVTAETGRVTAENTRRTEFDQIKDDYNTASRFNVVTYDDWTYEAQQNTTIFTIDMGIFNPLLDIAELSQDGVLLSEGDNYTRIGAEITLSYTLSAGDKINVRVFKGVINEPPSADGSNIMNWSISKIKLSADVGAKIDLVPVLESGLSDSIKYTPNAPNPISLSTVYGDNQFTHPKVLYFALGWKGSKYWMAYTPLPYYDESKENPCIAASNDAFNWYKPSGMSNPLSTPVGYDYNSDTHLVYRPDTDTLECWYRGANETTLTEQIFRRTTTDGSSWTAQELMYTPPTGNILRALSPVIIWDNISHKYCIWVVDNYQIKYYETPDGKNWSFIRTLSIDVPDGVQIWHIDVENTDLGYEMLISTKGNGDMLYYSKSEDNITWGDPFVLIRPNVKGSWDDTAIYRSCFFKTSGKYYVFYAGVSNTVNGTMYAVGLSISEKDNDIKSLNGTKDTYATRRVKEVLFTPSDKTIAKLRGNAGGVETMVNGIWRKVAVRDNGFGIRHVISTGTITRIGDAYGLIANPIGSGGNDFDVLMPWSGMRRCNIPDDFSLTVGSRTYYKVNAYYGDANYKDDGSNGQVMVEIPAFYYKRVWIDSDTVETYISSEPIVGYRRHPWFYDQNGNTVDKKFIGAYEASIYDVSAAAYLLNDEQVADFTASTGDKMCSRSGAKPCSGVTQLLTLPNSRILATNRGTGWQQQHYNALSAIQMLAMVEYAAINMQNKIGGGLTYITDDGATNLSILTGSTASLGNGTGKTSVTHPTTAQTDYPISYRGVENLWGNIWKWVDGINIVNSKPYLSIANGGFASNIATGQYMDGGFTLPTANGYVSKVGLNYNFDYGFLPSEATGSASTHFADYYYQYNLSSSQYVMKMGGSWSDGSIAGPFALSVADGSSSKSRKFGARLCT